MAVRPAKTQISLGIHPVWSESSLSTWWKLGSLAIHWVHSKDADQIRRMARLIWVFTGSTLILIILSCRGPYQDVYVILNCISPIPHAADVDTCSLEANMPGFQFTCKMSQLHILWSYCYHRDQGGCFIRWVLTPVTFTGMLIIA